VEREAPQRLHRARRVLRLTGCADPPGDGQPPTIPKTSALGRVAEPGDAVEPVAADEIARTASSHRWIRSGTSLPRFMGRLPSCSVPPAPGLRAGAPPSETPGQPLFPDQGPETVSHTTTSAMRIALLVFRHPPWPAPPPPPPAPAPAEAAPTGDHAPAVRPAPITAAEYAAAAPPWRRHGRWACCWSWARRSPPPTTCPSSSARTSAT
jgi:hypothetical protein